ncbi:MazG nucleotide pyrophosphohydrolase domain-containing protein [Nocardioides sp. SYSU DS0651]|uniref:MazG nucleotide pyrophosphohydrolase domain-containing protein n=1 Tax=Nocardioides sp. SYSU DS0651 TaxID=3415955 RepID=UPI003F4BD0A7
MPGSAVAELVAVMRRLRAECPWKRQQTHRSLVRYLLEEAYEAVEALEGGDDEHLQEELGDLLLQVVFHAAIAEERGAFDLDDVARGLTDKLRRRNPHVFGETAGSSGELDADAVNDLWQRVKAAEKDRDGLDPDERVLHGLPAALPALLYADKALDRLERAGRPVEVPPPDDTDDTDDTGDIGDRLLAVVAEARRAGVDPEQSLRAAVHRRVGD